MTDHDIITIMIGLAAISFLWYIFDITSTIKKDDDDDDE